MAKKKAQRLTVFATIEGAKREKILLTILEEIYLDDTKVRLKVMDKHGGNPDILLDYTLKHLHYGYDRMLLWIDEDKDLSLESKGKLYKQWCVTDSEKSVFYDCPLGQLQECYNRECRKPVLIVSQPVCVESLIIRALGKKLPHAQINTGNIAKQKRELKNALDGVLSGKDEYEYLQQQLTRQRLEEARSSIPELDLIISMITL